MIFQVLDLKDNHFFDLLGDELHTIESLYIQWSLWIRQFSHLNSLCARATRAIMNHAPIGEYHLRFFFKRGF